MKKNRNIYVCYHLDCLDGFTAAWVAWKKFKNRATYIPLLPDTLPKERISNALVYFLDLCPRGDKIRFLQRDKNTIIVIDHHISSADFVLQANEHLFDVKHSGAVLAWNYFFPGKKAPLIAKIVEDMDLWKFSLPHTKDIVSYMDTLEKKFELWDNMARELERSASLRTLRNRGKIIRSYENVIIQDLVKEKAIPVLFEGYRTYAVNSPRFNSQIGHALCTMHPPIGIIWSEDKNGVRVSLRSDESVDVSKLAKKYGGGGHKASAGFLLPSVKKLPWKKRNVKKKIL